MLLIDCDNIQNSEELLIEEFDWNIIQSTKIRSSFDETDNKETYYQSNENNKVLFVQQPSDLINITYIKWSNAKGWYDDFFKCSAVINCEKSFIEEECNQCILFRTQ